MIDPTLPDQGPPPLSNRLLRQFAGLWLLFCGLVTWMEYTRDRLLTALVFAGLGLAFGPPGLVRPQAIRPLFVFLITITQPLGWVVSHVLLAVLYYGVVTPLGLVFRLAGRDILCRRQAAGQDSYWTPKPIPTDVRSYFRQS
jgi:hypothetical protein